MFDHSVASIIPFHACFSLVGFSYGPPLVHTANFSSLFTLVHHFRIFFKNFSYTLVYSLLTKTFLHFSYTFHRLFHIIFIDFSVNSKQNSNQNSNQNSKQSTLFVKVCSGLYAATFTYELERPASVFPGTFEAVHTKSRARSPVPREDE